MEFHETKEITEKAILAGVHTGAIDELSDTTDSSIAELERLADTAGAEVVGILVQNRPVIENATYLGEGKLLELKEACISLEADIVIFDDELTPMQIRNIENELSVRVIDRSMLILDIFARHAVTKEGKLQVELAQLKYMLPRLTGKGVALSRLGGGIGTRGPGETKLETDKRHIRTKIHKLQSELKEIKAHRDLLRTSKSRKNALVVALAGYTNAGKSTLLNTLTGSDVLAENKLFATLDPTVRGITLPDGRNVFLVDTVGFISKLPHHLIEAFKSTLEEVTFADAILNVVDASSNEYEKHIKVVNSILSSLKANEKPTICVFNKTDLKETDTVLPKEVEGCEFVVEISAKKEYNTDKLVELIGEILPGKKEKVTLLIPYNRGGVLSVLHSEHNVLEENYQPEGIRVSVMLDSKAYNELREYRCD
ncbi:MAG: GTPase HflX [Ruminococcaceae bacterium]|nr:GTPase HflX [Oscillospiraceae bacterium]